MHTMTSKLFKRIALILLFFNGASALYGGSALIYDPTGKSIELPLEWLHDTPFRNFLVPGIILFLVNGMGSVVAFLLVIKNSENQEWYVLAEGCLLTGWIITELILTRKYDPLQAVLGGVGLVLIALSLLQFKMKKSTQLYEGNN
jgi:hypothetical protein